MKKEIKYTVSTPGYDHVIGGERNDQRFEICPYGTSNEYDLADIDVLIDERKMLCNECVKVSLSAVNVKDAIKITIVGAANARLHPDWELDDEDDEEDENYWEADAGE